MTTQNSGRNSLCYLLEEGGSKVCRNLLLKRVDDLKPSEQDPEKWTVNTFLQANKDKILSTRMGKDRKHTIFAQEDVMNFNLDELCFLLTEICALTKDLCTSLHQLRYITCKLLHDDDAEISDNDYKHSFNQLVHIIRLCETEVNDTYFISEVDKILERLDIGAVPQNDMATAVKKMKSMRKRVPLYSLENLKSNDFSDGDKLDIVIEKVRCIEARLEFARLTALNKDDVDIQKEKKMDGADMRTDLKQEHPKFPPGLSSLSSPLMEKL